MRRALGLLIGLIILALIPAVVSDSYTRHLFILVFIYAIIASNWDLSLGYAGVLNFAHTSFFATGVYTVALATKIYDINPWLAIPMGGITAALVALLVSAPVARLKGIYVILVTFAFQQLMVQLILSQSEITGGAQGIVRIPYLRIGDYSFIRDYKLGYYYVALALLSLSTLYLLWITASPLGKSFLALRDNEDYASARGVSIMRQRILVLVLSAIFTGITGGFFAVYLRVASPEVLSFGTLVLSLSIVLIGGVATIIGSIVASFIIVFATETMAGIQGMEEARFIVVAVVMILILRFAPKGLVQLFHGKNKKRRR